MNNWTLADPDIAEALIGDVGVTGELRDMYSWRIFGTGITTVTVSDVGYGGILSLAGIKGRY